MTPPAADASGQRRFSQVDVFAADAFRGNPVAVIHDAQGLLDEEMAAIARWTNLSETTFLLPPSSPDADYRLRIFTPGGELPFAGHPTLGSCHAWRLAGGVARAGDVAIQECAAGLVAVRRLDDALAFAAPPLRRSGALEDALLQRLLTALSLPAAAVVAHQWVDNGPGWCALLLDGAARVLQVTPNLDALEGISLGLVGPQVAGADSDFEVRAFVPSMGVPEDPVTGSLNAGIAQWLIGAGLAAERYVARQGTCLQRSGRVLLQREGDTVWVGGAVDLRIDGALRIDR